MLAKSTTIILLGMIMTAASSIVSAAGGTIEVPLNKSRLIPIRQTVKRVSVGQPRIADILVTNPKQLYILGKSLGTTNVVLWDENDHAFADFNVEVTYDLRTLKAKLHELFPHEHPKLMSSQGQLVVSGEISNATKMDAILKVADSFAPGTKQGGQKVVNLMQVGGVHQVMLEVKVAELSRSVLKRLGVNLAAVRPGSQTRIGLFNGGASFPNVVGLNGGSVPIYGPADGTNTPVGPVVQQFAPATPSVSGPGLFLSFLDPLAYFQAVIDAAKQKGLAKILAEPTLVTLSGQQAQFLSGGEFPVPVATGNNGSVSVTFKEYGIGLKFLPVVLDSGRMNLKVNVSVSDLVEQPNLQVGVPTTNQAFAIPSLTKRSTESTVELGNGQSLAIAGLISDNMRDAVTKFPGLGDLPILGQLFRSQQFQRDKSELVIFVTAHLAKATTASHMRLPTDGLVVPSDLEYYLLGKTVGKYIPAGTDTSVSQFMPDTEMDFGHDVSSAER